MKCPLLIYTHALCYQLLIGKGTSQLDQFRHSTNPVYKKIWKDKLEPHIDELPLVGRNIAKCIQNVLNNERYKRLKKGTTFNFIYFFIKLSIKT